MVTILNTFYNLACVITCCYYRFHYSICGQNKTVICHQARDLKLSVLNTKNEFEKIHYKVATRLQRAMATFRSQHSYK